MLRYNVLQIWSELRRVRMIYRADVNVPVTLRSSMLRVEYISYKGSASRTTNMHISDVIRQFESNYLVVSIMSID